MRLLSLALLLTAALALPLRPADRALAAVSGTNLGAIGFGTIVVDAKRSHVLVSGPTDNVVEILSYSGSLLSTIHNIYGAAGMVVDGDTLYVAESTAGTIARIDLTNPTGTPTTLGSGILSPFWLVSTGGLLWTADSHGHIISVDPTSGTVTTSTTTYYGADLAASPGDPATLFVSEDGLSPGAVYRLDVSSGSPVVAAQNTFTDQENFEGLAVSPLGDRVIPASGWPYKFEELSASTLQADGVIYPGDAYPSAVATSPVHSDSGDFVATALDNGYSAPDIAVDEIGKPTPIFTASTNNGDGTANVRPHGLALDPTNQHL